MAVFSMPMTQAERDRLERVRASLGARSAADAIRRLLLRADPAVDGAGVSEPVNEGVEVSVPVGVPVAAPGSRLKKLKEVFRGR
jgi:hypothetical protein